MEFSPSFEIENERGMKMTKFEEIGVEIQYRAPSKRDANAGFRYSCAVCCTRGMHITCDRCAIAYANRAVVEGFEALEELSKTGFANMA